VFLARDVQVARQVAVFALDLRRGRHALLEAAQLGAQLGVLDAEAGELAVDGVDLCAQLHSDGRAIGQLHVALLAAVDARLERRDVAFEALDVGMLRAVALARLVERGLLLAALRGTRAPGAATPSACCWPRAGSRHDPSSTCSPG